MDLDQEGLFRDDSDSETEFHQERESTKEFVVYLVDASPKMFAQATKDLDEKQGSHFHAAMTSIAQSLKTQIIGGSNDEVSICFFNTKEKQNLQNLNGVYVFNVVEREFLDRPTARLIKEFSSLEDKFMSQIGSRYVIISDSRENSLYNALWVAQALLRKGSLKTVSKRIVLFTNEDDPFGSVTGPIKADMIRTTLQRAKDTRDLGISIELLPLSRVDEEFNVSTFYVDMLGLENEEVSHFLTCAGERKALIDDQVRELAAMGSLTFKGQKRKVSWILLHLVLEDMTDQLRKRMFKKRKVKTLSFHIAKGICIEVNTYALVRPTMPGSITWLNSVTNLPLKSERSFICGDTGALVHQPVKKFCTYKCGNIVFSVDELSELKRITTSHLRLLGFKPMSCLKDYHNLRPSTFVFPSDEDIVGSTRLFIALHRSMLRLGRFAVAFLGSAANSRIVALVAQDEIVSSSGQVEPPGMHMIHLPYSDDIRHPEESHINVDDVLPQVTDDQVKKASALLRRIDLKDFSVCQFANPVLQRHYGILQAIALDEDEMPEINDETLPDLEGLSRPGILGALEDFKNAVYGENHDQEEADSLVSEVAGTQASKRRKVMAENAAKESAAYDWSGLAESGKLKELTVVELKYYLTTHNLPLTGKKEALISRILTHMGK